MSMFILRNMVLWGLVQVETSEVCGKLSQVLSVYELEGPPVTQGFIRRFRKGHRSVPGTG